MAVIHVHGTLEQGGEPVSGHLWFGGRHSSPRARFFAKPDGKLHGYLPRAGSWKVVFESLKSEPWAVIDLPPVEVEEPEAPGAVVEVALELPTGEAWGEVVDGKGEPVAGAGVDAYRVDGDHLKFSGLTDSDGRFVAKALAPGRYRFLAMAGARKSTSEEVEVSAGKVPQEIRLVMSSRSVRGRVVSAYGPVVGAGVDSQPIGHDGRTLPSPNLMLESNRKGAFEIGIPPEAAALGVVIYPEGYVARALLMPPSEEEAIVEVGGLGGTLVLESSPGDPRSEIRGAVLRWNGAEAPLLLLKQRWANRHGGSELWPAELTLPSMEPATYELCSSRGRDAQPAERRCVAGVLAPNTELRLSLAPRPGMDGAGGGG